MAPSMINRTGLCEQIFYNDITQSERSAQLNPIQSKTTKTESLIPVTSIRNIYVITRINELGSGKRSK